MVNNFQLIQPVGGVGVDILFHKEVVDEPYRVVYTVFGDEEGNSGASICTDIWGSTPEVCLALFLHYMPMIHNSILAQVTVYSAEDATIISEIDLNTANLPEVSVINLDDVASEATSHTLH